MQSDLLIGIDIGGTFTDAIVLEKSSQRVLMAFKVPSSPEDPADAVIAALQRVSEHMDVQGARVCHGTTIGTNALIERRGARTALLATEGFADVIELRRQDRPNLYDLSVELSEPLVPHADRFEVQERINADGSVEKPIQGLDELVAHLKAAGVQSIAVSLLHAYAGSRHEQALKEKLQKHFNDLYITLSSEISPELGEFERTSTTVVNSYIGPPVKKYINRLQDEAQAQGIGELLIVKSNGGLTSAQNAMQFPAHLIESGPAAGMMATAAYARHIARNRVIAFDMGGTTAKAGVVADYAPHMTYEFRADALKHGKNVGGYPIRSAVLDIVEIGSGGGSIAWIDEGGVPKVGPESAGAVPGPACYCRGGTRPTVTDVHAVIGTLCAETFVGTGVTFDRSRAVQAIAEHVAGPMGWTVEKAAYAIIDIAVASMNEMVKLATIRRGLDPRDFSMVASGGGGPLHAALVSANIGARETIVPPYPGMFSALGATLGTVKHDLSKSLVRQLAVLNADELQAAFGELQQRATVLLEAEQTASYRIAAARSVFCRYSGQLYELEIPLGSIDEPLPAIGHIESLYRARYHQEFGIDLPDAKVELVKLHVAVELLSVNDNSLFKPSVFSGQPVQPLRSQPYVSESGEHTTIPVYSSATSTGLATQGPLLIEHEGSTVWVRNTDRVQIASDGCVLIQHAR
jgi:N-methylhydantoinase A